MTTEYRVIDLPDRLQVAMALLMPGLRDQDNRLSFTLNDNRTRVTFWVWIDEVKCINDDRYQFEFKGRGRRSTDKRLQSVIVECDLMHNQGSITFFD